MIGGLRAPAALRRAQLLGGGQSMPQSALPSASREALEQRRRKWTEPRLGAAVDNWWRVVAAGAAGARLPRDAYVRLNCLLYKALVPVVWDNERALEAATEDWNFDGGGDDDAISKAQFFASLCELAEVWLPPVDGSSGDLLGDLLGLGLGGGELARHEMPAPRVNRVLPITPTRLGRRPLATTSSPV